MDTIRPGNDFAMQNWMRGDALNPYFQELYALAKASGNDISKMTSQLNLNTGGSADLANRFLGLVNGYLDNPQMTLTTQKQIAQAQGALDADIARRFGPSGATGSAANNLKGNQLYDIGRLTEDANNSNIASRLKNYLDTLGGVQASINLMGNVRPYAGATDVLNSFASWLNSMKMTYQPTGSRSSSSSGESNGAPYSTSLNSTSYGYV